MRHWMESHKTNIKISYRTHIVSFTQISYNKYRSTFIYNRLFISSNLRTF